MFVQTSSFIYDEVIPPQNSLPQTDRKYSQDTMTAFGQTSDESKRVASDLEVHQARLPTLPIPDLKHTLSLYLTTLTPLLSPDDYEKTKAIVEEFGREGGDGERLQKRLIEFDQKRHHPSWLEPFWDDSYLQGRTSNAINVNYFFAFNDHPEEKMNTQVARAAGLISGGINFYLQMKDGKWEMDTERGAPLCMSQYRRVFGATRIPGLRRDEIITYTTQPPTDRSACSKTSLYCNVDPNHVVVLCGNYFYWFDVIENGKMLPLDVIEANLVSVLERTEASQLRPHPIGVFTASDRTEWAKQRSALIKCHEDHAKYFEIIQSALLIICLGKCEPNDPTELSRALLHGPGTNRWFDKLNLIVFGNGKAGMNFEHAVGDGGTTIRVADEMYKWTLANTSKGPSTPTEIHEILWKPTRPIVDSLRKAYAIFKQEILANETSALDFQHFGASFIKASGLSPDGFVQVALQLTYFKMFGKPAPTYESASLRSFLHGRTETVRSCTMEALEFCKLAVEPIFGRGDKLQYEALIKAIKAHVEYMKQAKNANGVDRHLFGLRAMYELEMKKKELDHDKHDSDLQTPPPPLPIYSDPAYTYSSRWLLSTSHCGCPSLTRFGFGPVVPDGFGVGYMIKNNFMSFNVTSKYHNRLNSSSIFTSLLAQSLLLMQTIVLSNPEKLAEPSKSLTFTHPTLSYEFSFVDYDKDLE